MIEIKFVICQDGNKLYYELLILSLSCLVFVDDINMPYHAIPIISIRHTIVFAFF